MILDSRVFLRRKFLVLDDITKNIITGSFVYLKEFCDDSIHLYETLDLESDFYLSPHEVKEVKELR